MKYRIIKRSFTDGSFYYVIQERFWRLPFIDMEGYSSLDYQFEDIEAAKKKIEELNVRKLKDVVVRD
jgi:hypothetical protein